jgi:hypothetical protein
MNNSNYRQSIAIKIEHANENLSKATKCCLDYIQDKNPNYLVELGSYLGTFCNNLRSALNYAVFDYCQQRGFQKNSKGRKLSRDFPYGYTKEEFQNRDVVGLMSNSDPNLFLLVERIQPYHADHKWLGYLMKLSNIDKHEIIITVEDFKFPAIAMINGFEPKHLGSAVLVGFSNGNPVLQKTPCFVNSMNIFALPNGNWLSFSVDMGNKGGINVLPFMRNTVAKIMKIIEEFYKRI